MDLLTTTATTNENAAATHKTPEPDSESPPPGRTHQPFKPLSGSGTTNGVLKRHHHHHHHHHGHRESLHGFPATAAVTYKDCLKNHAASRGLYAVDGCGEFMPSPAATPSDPTSLKCAACGCHRNFHRREPEDSPPLLPPPSSAAGALQMLEFQPHHRHHPPPPALPPPSRSRSPESQSPPPISSSYYPSAPHMLLALSAGLAPNHPAAESSPPINAAPTSVAAAAAANGRKRFRTKFSPAQKEKMYRFAERVGWKMQKKDEELVAQFCGEVGVERGVLKVWMHNNKNTFARRSEAANGNSHSVSTRNGIEAARNLGVHGDDDDDDDDDDGDDGNENRTPIHHHNSNNHAAGPFATNGSSSSS